MAHTHSQAHPSRAASGPDRAAHAKALKTALALTATYTVVEIVGGLITGSLALLADAVHMLSDNVSLGLALIAISLAARPPTPQRSFGFQRAEILAALFNGVALIAVSIWILYEAYQRLGAPEEVAGVGMLAIASVGAVVNIVSARILASGSGESLNTRAALRHVLSDLAGSIGAITAAIVIIATGFNEADPIIGALIALLVAASGIPIIRDSIRILLEETPEGLDASEIGRAMAAAEGVVEIHDLHVWTITSGFPALSAHVVVGRDEDCHARRRELEALLHDRFELGHTTLQVEHEAPEQLLQIERADPGPDPSGSGSSGRS